MLLIESPGHAGSDPLVLLADQICAVGSRLIAEGQAIVRSAAARQPGGPAQATPQELTFALWQSWRSPSSGRSHPRREQIARMAWRR